MRNPTLRGVEAQATFKPLSVRHADFAAALIDPGRPVPPGLVGPTGRQSTRRFNVYRNNVVAGLISVLRDAFPATARIVGDEFFAAMARTYVAGELPASPMLFAYGAGFPDFVMGFEPVAELPYLPDVARIERAWIEAYYAPEACSISPRALAQILTDDLPSLRVECHPSVRLVRSGFPVLTIWQMNVKDAVPTSVNLDEGGEDVLIVRSEAEVEMRSLPPGGAIFLQALLDGFSMLYATRAAIADDERFDLSVNLAGLMSAHAFTGIALTRRPTPRHFKERASS